MAMTSLKARMLVLKKNDRIDLSRFNNKARLEGQTIFKDSRTGYMLIKDRAGTNAHGGSYWIKKVIGLRR